MSVNMSKAVVYFNQNYLSSPESFPDQSKRLHQLHQKLSGDGNVVEMKGVDFCTMDGGDLVKCLENQLVGDIRDLSRQKIIAFFGDGGTGIFLSALDNIGRNIEQQVRENPVCLGPGGTYIHASKEMGTAKIENIADFVNNQLDAKAQKVKIRRTTVVKTDMESDKIIDSDEKTFFGFAGTSFESYILTLNERKSRSGGRFGNALEVIKQASKDIFGPREKPVSRLRAFTTMPRWGFTRFWPEIDSLGDDHFYMMASDNADPLGMLKISSVVNLIGSNRHLLQAALTGIDLWKVSGGSVDRGGFKDILDKFRPSRVDKFSEDFDGSMLGGLNYSTDGYPHQVSLKEGQKAKLEIETIKESGITVIRKNL